MADQRPLSAVASVFESQLGFPLRLLIGIFQILFFKDLSPLARLYGPGDPKVEKSLVHLFAFTSLIVTSLTALGVNALFDGVPTDYLKGLLFSFAVEAVVLAYSLLVAVPAHFAAKESKVEVPFKVIFCLSIYAAMAFTTVMLLVFIATAYLVHQTGSDVFLTLLSKAVGLISFIVLPTRLARLMQSTAYDVPADFAGTVRGYWLIVGFFISIGLIALLFIFGLVISLQP